MLKKSSYITVRDERSLNLLKSWNINANLCSDPVWNIGTVKKEKTDKIGIQLRNCSFATEAFIEELAHSVVKHYANKEIVLLSLQNELDLNICKNLENKIKAINGEVKTTIIENSSNEKVIENIIELKELIAMRFHACLVAIKNDVKLLPISYDIKVEELAKEFNLETINKNKNISERISNFKNKEINYDKAIITGHVFNFETIESII